MKRNFTVQPVGVITRGSRWLATASLLAPLLAFSAPAFADVTVGKTFLDPATFVPGVTEQPIGLVNQGDVVVLAISALNNGALITAGGVTDNLPAGMVIAANPAPQFSAGCGTPTVTAVPGSSTYSYSGGQIPAVVGPTSGLCEAYVQVQVIGPTGTAAGSVATLNNTIAAGGYGGIQAGGAVGNSQPVTQSISVTKLRSLNVGKSFSAGPIRMGEPTTVSIVVANPNAGSAVGLTSLQDSLPAGLTAASTLAQWVCTAGGSPTVATAVSGSGTSGLVSFALPANSRVAANGSCTLTWVVTADTSDDDGHAFTNNVPASSIANDRGLASAAASASVTVQAPLAVTKSFSPGTVPAATNFSLTLTVRNQSAFTLDNLMVDDPLPAAGGGQMTIAAAASLGAGCSAFTFTGAVGASSLQLAGTSLAAGQSCVVTVPVSVSSNGFYTNTTQPPGYTSENPAITGAHTILPASAQVTAFTQITASKYALDPRNTAVGAGSVAPDNALAYGITLRNYSTAPLAAVDVTDPLPAAGGAQVTFAPLPAPTYSGCGTPTSSSVGGDSTAVFHTIDIPAAVGTTPSVCTIVFYVKVPVNWPAGTAIANTIPAANVSSGGTTLLQGPVPTASSPTAERITIAKATASSPIFQGQTSLVTITLTNNDYTDQTAVALSDNPIFAATLAREVVLADVPSASTTCGGAPTFVAVPGSTSFQASGLTVAQRSSCNVSFYVKAVVPGTYTNTLPAANVSGLGADGGAVTPPAAATAALTVQSAINATKTFAPASVAASGGTTRVTVTLQNVSSAQLGGVGVTDPLPAGLVIAPQPQASSTCGGTTSITALAGAASASLGGATLPASGSCLFQFNVITNGLGANPIVNVIPPGNITASGGLANTTAVSAPLGTFSAPVVSVQKSFSPASLTMVGAPSLLTITVSNSQPGAVSLTNLALTDNLPAGIVVIPNSPATTSCPAGVVTTPDASTVSLSGASLAAGASCTFTVDTTLKAQGSATNTIAIGAVHDDQNVSNGTAFSSNLSSLPSLGVAKEFIPATVQPGVVATLTIHLLNTQAFVISHLGVRDALPSGLVVATPSGASTNCAGGALSVAGNVIQLSGGTLPAAGASPASCDVSVNVVAAASGVYTNTINAGDATGTAPDGSVTANLQVASATLHVESVATVSKSFARASVDVGQVDRLTITVANPNTVALNNAILADPLPGGVYVANPANTSTTCAASTGSTVAVSAIPGPGGTSVRLTGARIPASASCSFAVDVLSNSVGSFTNVIPDGALRTDEGVTNAGAASASFTTLSPPTLGKQFTPVQIPPGGTSRLRIVLGNPNAVAITLNAGFADALPQSPGPLTVTGLDLASVDILPRCANAGTTATSVTIGNATSIPAGGCVVIALVTGTVDGTYSNVLPGSALSTDAGPNQIPATADLSISSTLVAITGSVFAYTNGTGVFDAAATALPGQVVQLLDASGTTVLASTTTTSLGGYAFVGLAPGTYGVREPNQPAGTLNGITTVGSFGGAATAVAATPSAIGGITLAAGQVGSGYNFGEVRPSSIAGTVFADVNNDGVQQSSEAGIAAEPVTLTGSDDTGAAVSLGTTSGADGSYAFVNLRPGTYTLTEGSQPALTADGHTVAGPVHTNGTATSAPGSSPGTASGVGVLVAPPAQTSRIAGIVLPPDSISPANNFAEVPTRGAISGVVFVDNNGDATLNGSDAGLAGLPVQLIQGGVTIASTATLADGSYGFTNLPAGSYSVSYNPAGVAANLVAGRALPGTTGGNGGSTPATALTISGITLTTAAPSLNSIGNNFTQVPQAIDVVKAAGAPQQVAPKQFQIPFLVVVGDSGTVPVTFAQASDSLLPIAPAGSTITIRPGSFSASLAGSAAQCAGPAAAFDGLTHTSLLSGGFGFAPGEKCVIGFVVSVDFGAGPVSPVVYNSAYASVASSANAGASFDAAGHFAADPPNALAPSDVSVNVAVAPAAAGQLPAAPPALPASAHGDATGGVPTPVSLTGQVIDLVKNAGAPRQVPAASAGHVRFEIPYGLVVSASQQGASNLQVVDDLAAAFTAGAPAVSVKAGSVVVSTAAPSAPNCAAAPTPFDGSAAIALLAGNFSLPQGAQCDLQFVAVVDYPSAASIPATVDENVAFAVTSLAANPTGGTVSGTGSAVTFVPAAAPGFIALDRSSGNAVVMGGNAAGSTVYSTGGGQSGNTGPTTTPTPTLGNQQLPATPGADNSNSPTTQVQLAPERIALAKAVGVLRELSASSYQVPYTLVVKNVGTVPLTNVQVMDNLLRTFNPTGLGGLLVQSGATGVSGAHDAPALTDPACTAAAGYDGTAQAALLGGSDTLLPGQKCIVSFVVTVNWGANPLPVLPLLNQGFANSSSAAQPPGGPNLPSVPRDPGVAPTFPASTLTSAASTNVVPTSSGAPGAPPAPAALPPIDPAAPASPTPVAIQPAYLDLVKALGGAPLVVDASTFDVSYVVSVRNSGTLPDYNVQLSDYLRGSFATPAANLPLLGNGGNGAPVITVTASSGHCTPAAGFDGNASSALLSGNDTLLPGETCALGFTVRVHYASVALVPNGVAQDNFAYASSTVAGSGANPGYGFPGGAANPTPTPPAAAVATDISTDGTTLPARANGDSPSPTPVALASGPDLTVRKTHSPAVFTEGNAGNYTITVSNQGYQPTQGAYTVLDTLPAGLTVAAIPVASGWDCSATVPGSATASCSSSTPIAGGAGKPIDNPNAIVLKVTVRSGACAHPDGNGQCSGASALVNNVRVSGGGEVNSPYFTANDAYQDPTPIQESGSISGQVWLDLNHDRLDNGEPAVPGLVAEVLDAGGTLIASATTDAGGNYRIDGLTPGGGYSVRFRDPAAGGYYGRPVSRDPLGGNDPTADAASGVVAGGQIQGITVPGGNGVRTNQSLPLDPGGYVYDSVTRRPVPGAIVTLLSAGGAPVAANCVVGGVAQLKTAASGGVLDGAFGFELLRPVPGGCPGAGVYQVAVTPPSGYVLSATLPALSRPIAPPVGCGNGGAAGVCVVQAQRGPPSGPQPTPYSFYLTLDPVTPGPAIVGDDIPLDPAVLPKLVITKTGDRSEADLGGTVRYTITIRRTDTGAGALNTFALVDQLPLGFRLISGTASLNGKSIADPAGAPGPRLQFTLAPPGGLAAGTIVTLNYRVRLGVGSQQGSGINSAQAMLNPGGSCAAAPRQCSNVAAFRVRVTAGIFTPEACITGKVYVDCNHNHVQDAEEPGIPGVRIYLENGQYFITDSEGKYSYCGLSPMTHVAAVDPLTLPRGSRLMESSNRNMGDAGSLFLDLRSGSLDRADFIEGSCSNLVLEQIKARRARGEVSTNENERSARPPLGYDALRPGAPAEATDSANQAPVKPRESVPPARGAQP